MKIARPENTGTVHATSLIERTGDDRDVMPDPVVSTTAEVSLQPDKEGRDPAQPEETTPERSVPGDQVRVEAGMSGAQPSSQEVDFNRLEPTSSGPSQSRSAGGYRQPVLVERSETEAFVTFDSGPDQALVASDVLQEPEVVTDALPAGPEPAVSEGAPAEDLIVPPEVLAVLDLAPVEPVTA